MRGLLVLVPLSMMALASCADVWGFGDLKGLSSKDAGGAVADAANEPDTSTAKPAADAACEGGACGIPSGIAVMFGGIDQGSYAPLNDTWTFDGHTWTLVPFANPPPAGDQTSWDMAALGHEVVLVGGIGAGAKTVDETWVFDGTVWKSLALTNAPSVRGYPAVATLGGRVVLFGGETQEGNKLDDTWTFDGTAWTRLAITSPPPARSAASMVAWAGRLILVGGYLATEADAGFYARDTWAFDGTSWTQLNAPGLENAESGILSSLAVQDNRLVLFGGFLPDGVTDQTWTFDGASWKLLNLPDPRPRLVGAPMFAYGHDLLLFGDLAPRGDGGTFDMLAWRFDGTHWSQQPLSNPPPARAYPRMALVP